MKTWVKSETGIRCLLALSVFLILSMCLLLYESRELISEIKNFSISEKTSGENYQSNLSDQEITKKIDSMIHDRLNQFLTIMLLILLGTTVILLLLSLKQFTGFQDDLDSGRDAEAITNMGTLAEEEMNFPDTSVKIFEAIQKINGMKDGEHAESDFFEDFDIIEDKEPGVLANSYNKMMEALQKINEMEKKHTIELANANKLLEKEVDERERAEKEIRNLSRQLISGIEDAQKKLAQDLHDEFGQTLAALHMGVETLWNSMPNEMTGQKKHIDDLILLIEQLGDKIRSISSDLRPDLLDDLGLVPTLEWYIKEFTEQRPDIQIAFHAAGFKKRLASEIELVLYRIFQESFNNIVKHSKAQNVDVILTYSYPKIILMVRDDGVGFNPESRSGGIGLIGMRERAVSVKGNIDIRSEEGKGSIIRVQLPVS